MNFPFKTLLTGVAQLLLSFILSAQPFQEGSKLPDQIFTKLYNYSGQSIQLHTIKKKLIIFDFWDFSCLSCIQAFPKIDLLQKKFNDQVQFILVNKQTPEETKTFLAKRKKLKVPDVPFICQDNLLKEWFPHDGEPYHVWIDSSFTVRYLLSGHNSTAERIDSFLKSYRIHPPVRISRKYISTFIDPGLADYVVYNSVITKCIPGIKIQAPLKNGDLYQFSSDCQTLPELLVTAFNENGKFNFNRPGKLKIEIADSSSYVRPLDMNMLDGWRLGNCYNFHLVVPAHLQASGYALMRQEICRYFNVEAFIERKKIPGLLLLADSTIAQLTTKGGSPEKKFYQARETSSHHDSIRFLRNMPYSYLSDKLVWYLETNFKMPVSDQIVFRDNIDISIEGKIMDEPNLAAFRKSLAKYGIVIEEGIVETDVLVIKERCGQPSKF